MLDLVIMLKNDLLKLMPYFDMEPFAKIEMGKSDGECFLVVLGNVDGIQKTVLEFRFLFQKELMDSVFQLWFVHRDRFKRERLWKAGGECLQPGHRI
jgi:hypothetical protein